jgi:hypothetical protein
MKISAGIACKGQEPDRAKSFQSPGSVPAFVHDELSVFGKRLTESERDTMIHKFRKVRFDRISPFNAIPQNLVLPYTHNTIGFDFVALKLPNHLWFSTSLCSKGAKSNGARRAIKTSAEYSNLRQGTTPLNFVPKVLTGFGVNPSVIVSKCWRPGGLPGGQFALYLMLFSFAILGLRRYEMNRICFGTN